MPNLVEISDFTGSFKIAQDTITETRFNELRDEKQFDLIYKIMGGTLGQLFIDDLDANGVPQTARFTALYDAFNLDDNYKLYVSIGIKQMVVAYLYFYWAGNNNRNVGVSGNSNTKGENSSVDNTIGWIVDRYNEAVATARNIQWYIGDNLSTYPEENRIEIKYSSIY